MITVANSWLVLGMLALMLAGAPSISALETPPDAARVQAIAEMLPEKPAAPGPPITDRDAWNKLAARPAYRDLISRAEALLKEPLPALPDELYQEYSGNGNRTRWEKVSASRRSRISPLVLAECLENKGRFVPAIEGLVSALCDERTWVMPAHDKDLDNFHKRKIDIDLASSALGWNLAVADILLGPSLGERARTQLRENVARRVLEPFRAMFSGQQAPNWWMSTTSNWNSVCLAGVTGAALAQLESRSERAEFVAAAEKYISNFLSGFTRDGYCSEGLSYWNYGFGHYALLSETIRRATGNKLELLAHPAAQMPARFGARIQIINNVAPAFADCGVETRPTPALMYLLNERLQLGIKGYDQQSYERFDSRQIFGSLIEALIYGPSEESRTPPVSAAATPSKGATPAGAASAGLRDWFDEAGILIGRPAPSSDNRLGVALKGGHNAEHHNHNDLGSYVVVLGDLPVLLDPGAETYTARTFSNRRYDSKLLNSFGHPVPIVANTLQSAGLQAAARVVESKFSDDVDTIRFDLASAYAVPDLSNLHREFSYSRAGGGSLRVRDEVAFKTPQAFGTALLTRGSWQRQTDNSLLVFEAGEALHVEIDTGGREYSVDAEEIREDAPVIPTRLGINLTAPVTQAHITLKITPWQNGNATGALLRNGGFESASFGWILPKNSMGAISHENFLSGKASLKISDRDKQMGSNVYSTRIPVSPETRYTLKGQALHTLGSGIGLYVRYLNARHAMLNSTTESGGIAPVGATTGALGQWQPFSFDFKTPPASKFIQIWIHSFNSGEVEAYLDDLAIVPVAE